MREHSRYGLTRTNAAYVFFLCETLPTWISLVDWVLFFFLASFGDNGDASSRSKKMSDSEKKLKRLSRAKRNYFPLLSSSSSSPPDSPSYPYQLELSAMKTTSRLGGRTRTHRLISGEQNEPFADR